MHLYVWFSWHYINSIVLLTSNYCQCCCGWSPGGRLYQRTVGTDVSVHRDFTQGGILSPRRCTYWHLPWGTTKLYFFTSLRLRGSVVRTSDSQSVGSKFNSQPGNNAGQVLVTNVPLSRSCIVWYTCFQKLDISSYPWVKKILGTLNPLVKSGLLAENYFGIIGG